MRRAPVWLVLTLAVSAASSGCRSSDSSPVDASATALRHVHSGTLDLSYTATPQGGHPVGFEVKGPFSVPDHEGDLVTADLSFSRLLGERRQRRRFVATGGRAWVVADGKVTPVPEDALDSLRAHGDGDSSGALGGLHFEDWPKGPVKVEKRPGGAQRVSGDVDPVKAFNDLTAMARSLGGQQVPGNLSGKEAERLRRAVRSARLELITGPGDRVPRSLVVTIDIAVKAAEQLREALGGLSGTKLVLSLTLDRPNEPVHVTPPG
jgi:hypothetical protein